MPLESLMRMRRRGPVISSAPIRNLTFPIASASSSSAKYWMRSAVSVVSPRRISALPVASTSTLPSPSMRSAVRKVGSSGPRPAGGAAERALEPQALPLRRRAVRRERKHEHRRQRGAFGTG